MGKEVARIDSDGDWLELDFREDSWHEVYLAWERQLNIVAVVMAHTVHDRVHYEDGSMVEIPRERVEAAVVPNAEAREAFVHPGIYIHWYGGSHVKE